MVLEIVLGQGKILHRCCLGIESREYRTNGKMQEKRKNHEKDYFSKQKLSLLFAHFNWGGVVQQLPV